MRAVVRRAWLGCICNLYWSIQAPVIQGAMLQRWTAVLWRVGHYLTSGRKELLGFWVVNTQKFPIHIQGKRPPRAIGKVFLTVGNRDSRYALYWRNFPG